MINNDTTDVFKLKCMKNLPFLSKLVNTEKKELVISSLIDKKH